MKLLFGASEKGKMLLEKHPEKSFDGFIDNDPKKWGKTYCGLKIFNPEVLKDSTKTKEITISSQYAISISEQLIKHEIRKFTIYDPGYSPSGTEDDFVEIDISDQNRKKQTSVIIHNHSGSNTLALHKSKELSNAGIDYETSYACKRDSAYFQNILNSKNLIITHELDLPSHSAAIQLWHGFPLKGLNLQSRYQSEPARQKARENWLSYKAITSYSKTYTTLLNSCYGVNIEKYHITGMPRNDFLFKNTETKTIEKILTKTKNKKTIFYLPTFRSTSFGQKNGDPKLELFGIRNLKKERLFKFLDKNDLHLVVKPHPYDNLAFELSSKNTLPSCVSVLSDELLQNNNLDFYQLLPQSDMLITDYSSVYFDYLLLKKPIIFTPSDIEKYDSSRGLIVEPYEFWAPGPKCFTQDQLETEILKNLESPGLHSSQRKKIRDIVHHFQDEGSSARTAKLISELLR